jgi:hypothetical protein
MRSGKLVLNDYNDVLQALQGSGLQIVILRADAASVHASQPRLDARVTNVHGLPQVRAAHFFQPLEPYAILYSQVSSKPNKSLHRFRAAEVPQSAIHEENVFMLMAL